MTQPIDMQSAIFDELKALLAQVPSFGAEVIEDDVLRVIDADDEGLPEDLIILQPGTTEEVERQTSNGVRERLTVNIVLMTRRRDYLAVLRAGRLAVKVQLAGKQLGLKQAGVQQGAFQPETPMAPRNCRRWAAQVMPVQIPYVQLFK